MFRINKVLFWWCVFCPHWTLSFLLLTVCSAFRSAQGRLVSCRSPPSSHNEPSFFFSQKAVGHVFTETGGVLWLLVSLLLMEKSLNNKLRVDFYKEKVWSFPISPWGLQQPCEPGGSCCLALKRFKLRILSTEQAFIFLFSSVIYYLSWKFIASYSDWRQLLQLQQPNPIHFPDDLKKISVFSLFKWYFNVCLTSLLCQVRWKYVWFVCNVKMSNGPQSKQNTSVIY